MANIFSAIIICVLLTILLVVFVAYLFFRYQNKVFQHGVEVNQLNSIYERELLNTKLLVQ